MTHDPKVLSEGWLSEADLEELGQQAHDSNLTYIGVEEQVLSLIAEVRAHRARSLPVSREAVFEIIEDAFTDYSAGFPEALDNAADAIITLLNGGKDAE